MTVADKGTKVMHVQLQGNAVTGSCRQLCCMCSNCANCEE